MIQQSYRCTSHQDSGCILLNFTTDASDLSELRASELCGAGVFCGMDEGEPVATG